SRWHRGRDSCAARLLLPSSSLLEVFFRVLLRPHLWIHKRARSAVSFVQFTSKRHTNTRASLKDPLVLLDERTISSASHHCTS
ncbi:unnamed protein product, partial [Tilletia laevis]